MSAMDGFGFLADDGSDPVTASAASASPNIVRDEMLPVLWEDGEVDNPFMRDPPMFDASEQVGAAAAAAAKPRFEESAFIDQFYNQPASQKPSRSLHPRVAQSDPIVGSTLYFSLGCTSRWGFPKPSWCLLPGRVVALSDPRAARREIILEPLLDVAALDIHSSHLYALPWPQQSSFGAHSHFLVVVDPAVHNNKRSPMQLHHTLEDIARCNHCSAAAADYSNKVSRRAQVQQVASPLNDLAPPAKVSHKRGFDDDGDGQTAAAAAAPAPAAAAAAAAAVHTRNLHARRFFELRVGDRRMGVFICDVNLTHLTISYWNLATRFNKTLSWSQWDALVPSVRTSGFDLSTFTALEPHSVNPTDDELKYTPLFKLYPSLSEADRALLTAPNQVAMSIEVEFQSRFPCTERWIRECSLTSVVKDTEGHLPSHFFKSLLSHVGISDLWSLVTVLDMQGSSDERPEFVDDGVWLPCFERFCREQLHLDGIDKAEEDVLHFRSTAPIYYLGEHQCAHFHRLRGIRALERVLDRHELGQPCILVRAPRLFTCRIKLDLPINYLARVPSSLLLSLLYRTVPDECARLMNLIDESHKPVALLSQGAKVVELAAETTHAHDLLLHDASRKMGAAVFPVSPVVELPLADFQCYTVQWMIEQERSLISANEHLHPTDLFRPYVDYVQLRPDLPRVPVHIKADHDDEAVSLVCAPLNAVVPRVCGGYLGDEMGAGKTMEMLAVILYDQRNLMLLPKIPSGTRDAFGFALSHATLIVMSTSLIGQWIEALGKYASHLSVLNFNDLNFANRDDVAATASKYDIVVVSDGVLRNESLRASKCFDQLQVKEPWSIMPHQPARYRSTLQQIAWRRVVIDEAHDNKSTTSLISRILASLNSQRRWCLSGTPVGLNSSELEPVCDFLGFGPEFRYMLGMRFSESLGSTKRRRTVSSSSSSSSSSSRATPDLRLNSATLHFLSRFARHNLRRHELDRPYLDRPSLWRLVQSESTQLIAFDAAQRQRYECAYQAAKTQLERWSAENQRNMTMHIVHTLLQPLLRMCSAGPMDSDTLAASIARVERRRKYAQQYGHVNGKAVESSASEDAKKHKRTEFLDGKECCPVCLSYAQELVDAAPDDEAPLAVQTPCSHVFCKPCVTEVLRHANASVFVCALCNGQCPRLKLKDFPIIPTPPSSSSSEEEECKQSDVGAAAAAAAAPAPAPIVINSAKIARLMELVHDTREKDPTSKFVVMLPHTHTFRELERVLPESGLRIAALRSSYSEDRRTRILTSFKDNPDIRILLLSMRGSGAGLSLACANHIVIFDTVMDISLLKQAPKRIARFDQEREIHIHHFVMKDTIEDRLREIIARTATQANSGCIQHLGSFDDLKALFNV